MKSMHSKKLYDEEARKIVLSELSKNIILEAGAGSGKTSAMATRFVELVSSGNCDISELVAITFTKKAANEIKERIRGELNKINSPLAAQLHRCFIGTIHAFCSKLLRERPIEAGIDPQFVELEEGEDKRIRDLVWEEYVMNANEDRRQILSTMDLFDLKSEALKKFLQIVCDNPDLEFELPEEEKISIGKFISKVDEAFEALRELIFNTLDNIPDIENTTEGKRDALQLTIYLCVPKLNRKQPLSPMEKVNLLKWFNTSTKIKVTQKHWGNDKEAKQIGKEIGEAFASFKANEIGTLFKLREEYAYNYVAVPFVKEAKIIYEARKKALGVLNFQDLLQGATNVLRDYPEVRKYFQSKYKVLLVDEFQDTDPVQAKMLMYLTGREIEEKDWNKITPHPGSLFVVGDPKQSIYGFRRADIDVYNKFKDIVLKAGGIKAELTTNFRSVNELGEWYNVVFPKILIQELEGARQAEFTRVDTVRESLPSTMSGVYKYKIDGKSAAEIKALDIKHTERIIKYLTSGKTITVHGDEPGTTKEKTIDYNDIMVLFLKKASLTDYGKKLAEAGIPVKTVGSDVIVKAPQFKALSDIINMLAYPEENALLYKVLCGSAFKFTDNDLFQYTQLGGSMNIFASVDGLIKNNEFEKEMDIKAQNSKLLLRIKEAFSLLKSFSFYMQSMVPAAATEKIITELGIEARMLYTLPKLSELSSFVSLIEKIRMNKLTNVWDLNQYIEEINVIIESGYEEDIDLEGENYNGVRMMNLHKAKGLEAPIVILAAPYSGKVKQPNLYVDRSKEASGIVYGVARLKLNEKSFNKEYISPAHWKKVADKALGRDIAEKQRLLYVAATRPQNMLIISDSASEENLWAPLLMEIEANSNKVDENSKMVKDIDRILVDENFDEGNEKRESKINGEIKDDQVVTLTHIIQKTKDTFATAESSYQNYTPSEKKKPKDESSEQDKDDFSLDPDLILNNSMEVYFEGDKEVFRSIRAELGTAVHKVFEGLIKGNKDKNQIVSYVSKQTEKKEITEKLLNTIADKFIGSNLWHRLENSKSQYPGQTYTEVPIAIKVNPGELYAGQTFDKTCYVNGSIDLVFWEEEGWTIVDYKTCAKNQVKSELAKQYQPQLDSYKEAWGKAINEKVAKTEIFFVEKG